MLATVDPAVAGVLAYVDAVRDEMRALWPVPEPVMARAMHRFRADWAAHSARLAGAPLTLREANALLLHDRVAAGRSFEDHAVIRRHAEAARLVESFAAEDTPPLAEAADALRQRLALGGEAPAPSEQAADGGVHPIVRAAALFASVADGHEAAPIARLLASLVVMRADYLPVVFREERAADAHAALAEAADGHEAPLVRYVAEELAATMERFLYLLRGDAGDFGERVDALASRVQAAREARGFGVRSSVIPFVEEVLIPLNVAISEAVEAFCPRVFATSHSRGVVRLASGVHIAGGIRAFRKTAWAPSLRRYTQRWTLARHALDPAATLHVQMRGEVEAGQFRVVLSSSSLGDIGTLDGTARQLPGDRALREAVDAVRARLVREVESIGGDERQLGSAGGSVRHG